MILNLVKSISKYNKPNRNSIRHYYGHRRLQSVDPEMFDLIQSEKHRQLKTLNLIASENYCSLATQDALSSCLVNKYSEGYVGSRFYAGNEIIDKVESLVQSRALELFDLDPSEWGVNVQAYSGSIANFAVYTALLRPHDRIMGLDLSHGGHLSHGFQVNRRPISASAIYFDSLPYRLNTKTELIDYDELEETALRFFPKLIIAGTSCYSRLIDYARIKQICDKVGAYLLSDIAHISGLIAAKLIPTPFPYSDIVTTTTQKLLRSCRGSLIFYRHRLDNNPKINMKSKIDRAVFPGLQGGPHNHSIASIGVSLKEALSPEYITYQKKLLSNSKLMCNELQNHGYRIVSGGTDNHLCLVDLKPQNICGSIAEHALERVSIIVNRNTCPNDVSALKPSGIRLGMAALTSRNFKESDVKIVADYIVATLNLLQKVVESFKCDEISKFDELLNNNAQLSVCFDKIKSDVEKFACSFPTP